MLVLVIIGVIAAIAAIWMVGAYNRLIMLRERVRNGYAMIDVQLERRFDLIPNLVEVAKGFMRHEQDTLTSVIDARAAATQARIEVNGDPSNAKAMASLSAADNQLGTALGRLLMVSEQYPDLKSDATVADLMEELRSTENKVSFARQSYNDANRTYEQARQMFPTSVIASMFGFQAMTYLEASSDEARQRVAVELS